jgi:hypothetical protein
MIPGPDKIIACPACGAHASYGTLESGNTIGMRLWSDGWQIAPMLPRPPAVVQCRQCEQVFWLRSAAEVGESNPREWKADLAVAPRVEEPSEAGYRAALERGLASSPEEEKTLRIHLWWRSNKPFRALKRQPAASFELGHDSRNNLERLLTLLGEGGRGPDHGG